jgi:large subunit ribosomal protein L35
LRFLIFDWPAGGVVALLQSQIKNLKSQILGIIMPKLKTHKGAAKRFRTTASGKVKRGHSHARHILTKKTAKRKRALDIDVLVSESDEKRIERMLPYGRS